MELSLGVIVFCGQVFCSVKARLRDKFGNVESSKPYYLSEGASKLSIEVNIDAEYHAGLALLYREASGGSQKTENKATPHLCPHLWQENKDLNKNP